MKKSCPFESRVASIRQEATPEIDAHLEQCESCRRTVLVTRAMRDLVSEPIAQRSLADPRLIWLKSRIVGHREAVARARRPFELASFAAYLIVACSWALVLVWKWPAIQALLADFDLRKQLVLSVFGQSGLSMQFLAILMVLTFLTFGLTLHSALGE
ncbi:MAG: hypothetical protein WBX15_09195 [Thermoanaerobaculia bacterium]